MSRTPKKNKSRKPTVSELVAARNPLKRLAVTPLDPYQVPKSGDGSAAAPPEAPAATEPEPQGREASGREAALPSESVAATPKMPDSAATDAEQASPKPLDDVVVPYSTHIRRSLIRSIKLRAFTTDRKDREIVEAALEEYFENHPVNSIG